MAEVGEVVGIYKEKVTVKLTRTEACAKCRVCAAGMSGEDMLMEALNLCDSAVGDRVELEIEGDMFLKAVSILYGIPLVLMLTSFLAGFYGAGCLGFPYAEFIGFCLGIICVCGSFLWIKKNEPLWKKQNFIPKAVRLVRN